MPYILRRRTVTTEEILHLLARIQRRQSTCLEFLTIESSGCGHVRFVGVWVEGGGGRLGEKNAERR